MGVMMEQNQISIPADYELLLSKLMTLTKSQRTVDRLKKQVVVISDSIKFKEEISKLLSELLEYDNNQENIFLTEERQFIEYLNKQFKNLKSGIEFVDLEEFKNLTSVGFLSVIKRLEVIKSELSRDCEIDDDKSHLIHIITTYFKVFNELNQQIIKLIDITIQKPNLKKLTHSDREEIGLLIRKQGR